MGFLKKLLKWTLITPVVLFVLLYIVLMISDFRGKSASASNEKLNLSQDQTAHLKSLEKDGYLRFEANLNRVYIEPSVWRRIDAKGKEDFSAGLAIYVANKNNSTNYWVEVYDKMSGKRLAKYSRSWGFTID